MTYRLLFVCLGNICRSPAAEGVMKHLLAEAGLSERVFCDSAGTSSYHIGAPPDRRMRAAASQRGLTLTGQARQFEPADFEAFDLILAMDRDNYQAILRQDPQGRYADKVKLIGDFAREHSDREVPDPYYGGPEGFNYVIDLLLDACSGLLADLQQTGKI